MTDSFGLQVILEHRRCVLSTIVGANRFQLPPTRFLHECFPSQETPKDFILALENVDPSVVSAIVDESEEVLSSTQGTCIHLPADIAVYEIQWFCSSGAATGWEDRLLVFAFDACLTEVEILGVVEVETLDERTSFCRLFMLRWP